MSRAAGALPPRIVFFDGDCGLCTRSVRFLLRRDRRRRLVFAPLAGETARRLLDEATIARSLASGDDETLIYLTGAATPAERRTDFSAAWLAILNDLGGPWRALSVLARIIPRPLRDALYRWVARHRRRWFPKPVTCAVADSDEVLRVLP